MGAPDLPDHLTNERLVQNVARLKNEAQERERQGLQAFGVRVPLTSPDDRTVAYLVDGKVADGPAYVAALAAGRLCAVVRHGFEADLLPYLWEYVEICEEWRRVAALPFEEMRAAIGPLLDRNEAWRAKGEALHAERIAREA